MRTAASACGSWILACCIAASAEIQPLSAQTAANPPASTAPAATVTVRPGQQVVLDTAPCLVAVDPPPGGAVEIARASDAKLYAVYNAPAAETPTSVIVVVDSGAKPTADGKGCEAPARKRFQVTISRTPEVPPGALEQSFRILVSAFVLAVLLENAFALLFNWRLFLEFFVGKAWRTPIMFLGALAVVRNFDLDLMAQLFQAYNPTARAATDLGWFTSAITAMVLAGGSVGVNRVMVALGFRSQIRPDAVEPELEPTEAYVAVRVLGAGSDALYRVNMDVIDPIPPDTPTSLGFVGGPSNLRARFVDLLFPVRSRIPRSGGLRVSTKKAYRVSVTDLTDGRHYDTLGKPIETPQKSQVFAFAPKAIVDFTIRIDRKKPPAPAQPVAPDAGP